MYGTNHVYNQNRKGFRNYSDLKEDYDDYFTMNCEIDSRSYAEEAPKKYLNYINE